MTLLIPFIYNRLLHLVVTMSYDKSRVTSARLEKTPSLLFNNLTAAEDCLTYIHRYEAYTINRTALNGHTPCKTTALPNPEGHLIQEVKWCKLDDGEFYLVMCMESGVMIADHAHNSVLKTDVFEQVPVKGDKESQTSATKQPFAQGVSSLPAEGKILVGSSTGEVIVFKRSDKSFHRCSRLSGHAAPVSAIATEDTEGKHFASADAHGTVVLWDTSLMEAVHTFEGAGDPCVSLAFRDDAIVAGYTTGLVKIFSVSDRSIRAEIAAHTRAITALSMHPKRPTFATVSEDAMLNVWSLPDLTVSTEENRFKVVSDNSINVEDHLLTGVQFIGGASESSMQLVVDAYDTLHVRAFYAI
eukprot:gb/GECG01002029.1/.p1 GENE.gb/GECG01002029.1/~~gb/GECG01002029.1/.p1  ORF type:complete len:357 (+),score=28.11 gb/GECG01002029.1/:1-1071(+)